MTFINSFMLAISFLPSVVQAAILGFIAVLIIVLVFRIVGMVLAAIPFL